MTGTDNNYTNWYILHGGGPKTIMARDSTVYIGICKLAINIGVDAYTVAGSRPLDYYFDLNGDSVVRNSALASVEYEVWFSYGQCSGINSIDPYWASEYRWYMGSRFARTKK